jgi:hypothetical protein
VVGGNELKGREELNEDDEGVVRLYRERRCFESRCAGVLDAVLLRLGRTPWKFLVLALMLPLLTLLSLSTMPLPLILLLLISGVLFQEYAIPFDVFERTPRRCDAACIFYL